MLISTEPLAERHEVRAQTLRNLAVATGVVLALLHGVLFASVHDLRLRRTVPAIVERVTAESEWVRSKRGRYHQHTRHTVWAHTRDGQKLIAEVSRKDNIASGAQVPFIVGLLGSTQIGEHAVLASWKAVLFVLAMVVLALFFVVYVKISRPWYDQDVVVETESVRADV